MIRITSLALAIAMAGAAAPALAQNNDQEGLVNVNIANVANNLAQNLSVDVSQIPVTVQVPVGIAANVCGVEANVLAQDKQGSGVAECTASSTSNALEQVVQKQMKKG